MPPYETIKSFYKPNLAAVKLIVWKLVLGYDSHSRLLHECHLYFLIFVLTLFPKINDNIYNL